MRLALLLLLAAGPAQAQLAGTYTINPALPPGGSNFQTIGAAVGALEADGVSAPVTFEVAQATYAERVTFDFTIGGASATNTVRFLGISAGAVRPVVRVLPSASQPWVWRVEKAQWVVIENLAIEVSNVNQSRGTVLQIAADDVVVLNCEIESIDDAFVGAPEAVGVDVRGNRVRVEGTSVTGGAVGIRYALADDGPTTGGQVLDNTVDRSLHVGILVEDQAAASGNAISIRDNTVDQDAPDEAGWVGIHLRDHAGGAVLARNRVLARTGTAVRVEGAAAAGSAWISVVNTMAVGSVFATGPSAGIELVNADRVRVQNNSVYLPTRTGAALAVDAASSVVDLRNNILVHDGEGPLLDVASGASLTAMDFSVFYAPEADTRFRVRWQGADLTTLAALQSASGREASGIVWPVTFLTSADLHLAGRSVGDGRLIGTPLPSSVPSDYDGDARSATRPYRGADEASVPLAPPPPLMAGTYDINGALPTGGTTYQSFAAAVADLDARGVGGPVTVRVAPGTYAERVDLAAVPGTSSTNRVRFEAASGTPQVRATGTSVFDDYVLRLTEVEFVTFAGIEFRSLGTTFADVAEVLGGRGVTFDGCTFRATTTQARGTLLDLAPNLTQDIPNPRAMRVLNSTFVGGQRGVNLVGIQSGAGFVLSGDHEIIGNTISGQLSPTLPAIGFGISVGAIQAAVVRDNVITIPTSAAAMTGILLGSDTSSLTPVSDVLVERNEIRMADGIGIQWMRYRDEGASPPALRIANNTVRMSGNGATIGIDVRNSDGLLVAHNTASVASTHPASAAARITMGSVPTYNSFTMLNNVFDANAGRALDLDVSGPTPRYTYNHTTFASQGAALASYRVGTLFDGDCATIECIRAASATASSGGNQDLQSNVLAVTFANAPEGDLRLAPAMHGNGLLAGTALAAVPADIDGDARSTTHPYRGADEGPVELGEVQLIVRVLLQGAYPDDPSPEGNRDNMRTLLRAAGLLPLAQPYAAPAFDGTPYEYDGTESVTPEFLAAHPTLVDWGVIGLRTTPAGPDVARRAVFIERTGLTRDVDGSQDVTFPNRAAGAYHVVVYHRSHLPVMSATTVTLGGAAPTVTFERVGHFYGGTSGVALLEQGTSLQLYGMIAGDAWPDGRVTVIDRLLWRAQASEAGYVASDADLDGAVLADDAQRAILLNQGRVTAVPGASLAPTTSARDAGSATE